MFDISDKVGDGITQEMLDKGKTAAPAHNFNLSAFCRGNEMDKKKFTDDDIFCSGINYRIFVSELSGILWSH